MSRYGKGSKSFSTVSLWNDWPCIQVGSIPYAEAYGERYGYASIQEFLSYMDRYILDPAPEVQWRGTSEAKEEGEDREKGDGVFSPPFYVFDSQVLERNFSRFYSMPSEHTYQ